MVESFWNPNYHTRSVGGEIQELGAECTVAGARERIHVHAISLNPPLMFVTGKKIGDREGEARDSRRWCDQFIFTQTLAMVESIIIPETTEKLRT